jgi:hypothetical protein
MGLIVPLCVSPQSYCVWHLLCLAVLLCLAPTMSAQYHVSILPQHMVYSSYCLVLNRRVLALRKAPILLYAIYHPFWSDEFDQFPAGVQGLMRLTSAEILAYDMCDTCFPECPRAFPSCVNMYGCMYVP